ncbi:MAG: PKD domain-containing protein, partial [Chitinophagales bacterium]|nr:PKD domain-containing protein [Chitinophagales bacterium]
MKKNLLLFICAFFLITHSRANTYVVLNNLSNGLGSLRSAINDANNHLGTDTITFNIPDGAVSSRTITLGSHLPALEDKVIIDASTQNKGAYFGSSYTKIQLTNSVSLTEAFDIEADSCEIYGFFINNFVQGITVNYPYAKIGAVNKGNVIYKCTQASIYVFSTDHVVIISNLIGVDTSQNVASGTYGHGIELVNCYAIAVGGHSSSSANVISGNNYGIRFDNSAFCDVNGNFIGTDASGNISRPNNYGIRGTGLNTSLDIGGDSVFERNIISGNTLAGIYGSFADCTFRGNYIGVKTNGIEGLGNGTQGIYFSFGSIGNLIGGEGDLEGNIIAYNGQEAIYFINATCSENSIRRNATFCNSQTSGNGGLKLSNGNEDINPPTLTIANSVGVNGITYSFGIVDIFLDDDCSFCEGKTIVGSVTANSSGYFSYSGGLSGKITATVTDTAGNTSEFAECIVPDNIACMLTQFISSSATLCTEIAISFIDQTVSAPGTSIVSWEWNFGDGNFSSEQFPTHQFSIAGSYTVTLVTTNDANCSDSISKIIFLGSPPVASFMAPAGACQNSPVIFTDQSLPGGGATISTWNWELGDGNNSSAQNPTHTYTSTGTFEISLTVKNSNGCYDTYTYLLQILEPPIASFTYSSVGLKVYFTNTSLVNEKVSYKWNFGDQGTSSNEAPSHTYNIDGLYNVCLVVYDSVCTISDTTCSILDLLTGIKDVNTNKISISPNPVNSTLLVSEFRSTETTEITIYDAVGRKIIYLPSNQLKTTSNISIDVSEFMEGIYFIYVKED